MAVIDGQSVSHSSNSSSSGSDTDDSDSSNSSDSSSCTSTTSTDDNDTPAPLAPLVASVQDQDTKEENEKVEEEPSPPPLPPSPQLPSSQPPSSQPPSPQPQPNSIVNEKESTKDDQQQTEAKSLEEEKQENETAKETSPVQVEVTDKTASESSSSLPLETEAKGDEFIKSVVSEAANAKDANEQVVNQKKTSDERSRSPRKRNRSRSRANSSRRRVKSRSHSPSPKRRRRSRSRDRSRRRSPRRYERHRTRSRSLNHRPRSSSLERRREERKRRHAELEKREEEAKRSRRHNSASSNDRQATKSTTLDTDNATVTDEKAKITERQRRTVDLLTSRTGGAYIPPAKLRMMQAEITDKTSAAYQRIAWEALKKSIHGYINKVNVDNIAIITRELLHENIVRGRGLLCRSIIQAQAASPTFTHVYAALVSIINSKFPKIGELLLTRLVIQFKRAYRRNDKIVCLSASRFIAHLVNQRVVHEILALEVLTLLVEAPTDDSVEVAIAFLKECGMKLSEVSAKGMGAIFEMLKNILHEGKLDRRVQYMIEVVFQVRKDGFKDHSAVISNLELVEEDDQFTHLMMLEEAVNPEDLLNVFKFDEKYAENENKYKGLSKEILGSDNSDDSDGSGSGSGSSSNASGDEGGDGDEDDEGKQTAGDIIDSTETNLIALRRTIYLTINSSLDYEECAHKLMKMQLKPGQEIELCHMFLDCCAEQRTYEKFYGLLAQRFCTINKIYILPFEEIFRDTYNTTHRLDTNRLRNVSKFFAHLLFTDAISWDVLDCIQLNEDDTTSSSRIFVKILFQELAEYMGLGKLNNKLKEEVLVESLAGLFPKDHPRNTRFSINFFTSIGLGGLTDDLRRFLKTAPKVVPAINADLIANPPLEIVKKESSSSSSSASLSSSESSESDSSESSDSEPRRKKRKRKNDKEKKDKKKKLAKEKAKQKAKKLKEKERMKKKEAARKQQKKKSLKNRKKRQEEKRKGKRKSSSSSSSSSNSSSSGSESKSSSSSSGSSSSSEDEGKSKKQAKAEKKSRYNDFNLDEPPAAITNGRNQINKRTHHDERSRHRDDHNDQRDNNKNHSHRESYEIRNSGQERRRYKERNEEDNGKERAKRQNDHRDEERREKRVLYNSRAASPEEHHRDRRRYRDATDDDVRERRDRQDRRRDNKHNDKIENGNSRKDSSRNRNERRRHATPPADRKQNARKTSKERG